MELVATKMDRKSWCIKANRIRRAGTSKLKLTGGYKELVNQCE
jgi:hypothetical protein